MIMCTLLLMVYRVFKLYWLTHVTFTCFKETNLLFNVHLSCFVDFILCPADKYMFKVNKKKIRLKFDHSQHINIVFLLLALNKYLPAGSERKDNALKTQKAVYLFRNESFKAFFIQRLIIAQKLRQVMNVRQCFSSNFALRIPILLSFRPIIWSAISSPFHRDIIF